MHMGMVVHPRGPSVQDGEDGGRGAHVALVAAQLADRAGGRLHQEAVGERLVRAEKRVQFRRDRHANMIVRTRQQLLCARLEPLRRLAGVAGGTTAVAAAVVHIEGIAAAAALIEMPAHGRRAAGRDVLERAAVRRQHPRAEGIQIGRAELADHVRNFQHFHDTCPPSIKEGHGETAHRVIDALARGFGQMQVGLRRFDARVAQKDADRLGGHPFLNEPGGEAMPQRMRLYILLDTRRGAGELEGLADHARIDMARAAPVGKEPQRVAVRRPHDPQIFIKGPGQRRQTLLVPLAHHANDHLVFAHIAHRHLHRLADAQATAIHRRQHGPAHRRADLRQEGDALFVPQGYRKPLLRRRPQFFLKSAQSRSSVLTNRNCSA
jgi:hypothetical protein